MTALAIWTAVRGMAAKVPMVVWVVLAVLGWGFYNQHERRVAETTLVNQQRQAAAETASAVAADKARTAQIAASQTEAINDLLTHKVKDAAAVARAADTARRLQQQLAADAAYRRAGDPDSASTGQADRLSVVFGQCVERYRALAASATSAVRAGQLCERAYDAVKSP